MSVQRFTHAERQLRWLLRALYTEYAEVIPFGRSLLISLADLSAITDTKVGGLIHSEYERKKDDKHLFLLIVRNNDGSYQRFKGNESQTQAKIESVRKAWPGKYKSEAHQTLFVTVRWAVGTIKYLKPELSSPGAQITTVKEQLPTVNVAKPVDFQTWLDAVVHQVINNKTTKVVLQGYRGNIHPKTIIQDFLRGRIHQYVHVEGKRQKGGISIEITNGLLQKAS